MRRNESWAFWPSSVLVCSHSSPRAIRSAPGVATTPYRPGIRLGITAWPASGDSVAPSDSNFGQVTSVPVMPNCVGSRVPAIGLPLASNCGPTRESFEGGNGSGCVSTVSGAATPGTTVPAGTQLVAGAVGVQVGAVVVPVYCTAVQVVTPAVVVQLTAAGTGTPLMPWPQAPGSVAAAEPFVQSALRLPLANGLPASPGNTVR